MRTSIVNVDSINLFLKEVRAQTESSATLFVVFGEE